MEPLKPSELKSNYILDNNLSKLLNEAHEVYGEYKGYLKCMPFDYKYLYENLLVSDIYYSFKIDGLKNPVEDMFYFSYMIKNNDVIEFNNMSNVFMQALSYINRLGFDTTLLNKMNKALFKDCKKDNLTKGSGKFRNKQTYILKPGIAGSVVSFVPPIYTDLNKYMKNLCEYVKESSDDVFIKTIIVHTQFQRLHPYISGNGKISRLLNTILISNLKNEIPILFISESLYELRNTYFNLLSYNGFDQNEFIKLFLECIIKQCNINMKRIKKINKVYTDDISKFKTEIGGTTIYKVYPYIIKRIVFTTSDIVNDTKLHINSVNKVLNKLVESGYLVKEKKKGTNRVTFKYNNMYNILISK